jgi:hypothetical protein
VKNPTTLQGLHNTLLYIRFRINYNWLSSGFGEQQYREMEAALVNAIIQLQQIVTPPPTKPTSATKIPMFQTHDERIHSILHAFVNKIRNKQAEEKENAKCVRFNYTARTNVRYQIADQKINSGFHIFVFVYSYNISCDPRISVTQGAKHC